MYEYFGVGLEIQEEVNDIYPRFLHWFPKYRLSTTSKRSLEIWRMVIDNLTVDDVSPSSLFCGDFGVWWWFLVLDFGLVFFFFILGSFVIFRCLKSLS